MRKIPLHIIALFIFIILTWGLAWPVNKIGLEYLSPLWYTAVRLAIGTVTMFALVLVVRKFKWPSLRDIPLILVIGILQISLYILLTNIGLAYLPAGRASLLAYTTPLWVMPAATLFFHEEAGPLRWLGFFLGIGGLFLLMSPWEIHWNDRHVLFGSFILLLASLSWAISMLCVRYMHWSKTPLELMPWQLLLGTIPLLLYAWTSEPFMLTTVHWTPVLIISLIYTGFLVTGLSYWSGVVINRALPTTIVSLGFLVVPVFSLAVSAIFMHEVVGPITAIAMAAILAGLVCVVV